MTDVAKLSSCKKVLADIDRRFIQLLDCYYLGVSLGAQQFRNYVMDRIIEIVRMNHFVQRSDAASSLNKCALGSRVSTVKDIYDKTFLGARLRMFLIEYHLPNTQQEPPIDAPLYCAGGCGVYITDLLIHCRRLYGQPIEETRVWRKGQCHYHEHEEEVEGYVCQKTIL